MNRPETFDLDLASDMRVTQGQLGEFMYADEANAFMDSQQSKLEEVEKVLGDVEGILRTYEYGGSIREKLLWLERDMLTAQRKQKTLESQLEGKDQIIRKLQALYEATVADSNRGEE